MEFSLISVILAFGITQGIVTGVSLFFHTSGKRHYNYLLACLLFCLSFTLAPTFLGQLGLVDGYRFLYFLPVDFRLFLFPLLFLYFQAILGSQVSRHTIIAHLGIAIFFWCYFFIVWIVTLETSQKGEAAAKVYFFEIQLLSQLIWILMIFYYSLANFKFLQRTSTRSLSKSQQRFIPWLKGLFIVFMCMGAIEFSALLVGKYYGYWKGSPIDKWLDVSLALVIKCAYAVVLYSIAFIGYSKFRKLSYSAPKIQPADADIFLSKMTSAMEEQKHYLNPNFTLSDLAGLLNVSSVYVSTLLNTELKLSFNDFVNQYRVRAVKEKLSTDAVDKYTLQYLAQESGFKSKTTFYRAFQKFTKQSPSDYLRQIKGK